MSKVYTIAFRMGVLFNVLLWTTLNLIDFSIARNNFYEATGVAEVRFSGLTGFQWGMPLGMFWNATLRDPYALVFNAIIYVVCGFFFGFLFKFVWSKIPRHNTVLK